MNLALVSLNYKHAPVEVRERLDVPEHQLPALMDELKSAADLHELFVLSTCNRVEIYFVAEEGMAAAERLKAWLAEKLEGTDSDLDKAVLVLTHHAAVVHLARVACSLESMVVGEPQILGQVKDAYQVAVRSKSTGPVLSGMMPRIFHTAKRVRTETEIARNAVSVSYAAVELATKIFDSLEDKTVLMIGAGEMAELAIAHLQKAGIRRLLITNRTFANGVALAEKFQGEARPFDEIADFLPEADIVISSTGARGFIIGHEMVRQALRVRKRKPMFFIDIAVPRDIDPEVNSLTNAYCYDIDDLNSAIDANRREREREALRAQSIVEEEVARYGQWYDSLSAVPTIKSLRQNFHAIGERELERAMKQLPALSTVDAQQVRQLVHGLVNKLLHSPSTSLKELTQQGNGKLYAEAVTVLFGLDGAAHGAGGGERGSQGGNGTGSGAGGDEFPSHGTAADDEAALPAKVVRFPVG